MVIGGGVEALVVFVELDEVHDAFHDGLAVLGGVRSLAVPEVAEEGEAGHGALVVLAPRAVLVLLLLEVSEGVFDALVAEGFAAVLLAHGGALGLRASAFHGGWDGESASESRARASESEAGAERASELDGFGDLGELDGGCGDVGGGGGCDDGYRLVGGCGGGLLDGARELSLGDLVLCVCGDGGGDDLGCFWLGDGDDENPEQEGDGDVDEDGGEDGAGFLLGVVGPGSVGDISSLGDHDDGLVVAVFEVVDTMLCEEVGVDGRAVAGVDGEVPSGCAELLAGDVVEVGFVVAGRGVDVELVFSGDGSGVDEWGDLGDVVCGGAVEAADGDDGDDVLPGGFLEGDDGLGEIAEVILDGDDILGTAVVGEFDEPPCGEDAVGVLGDGRGLGEDLVGMLGAALLDEHVEELHPEIPVFGVGLQRVVERLDLIHWF